MLGAKIKPRLHLQVISVLIEDVADVAAKGEVDVLPDGEGGPGGAGDIHGGTHDDHGLAVRAGVEVDFAAHHLGHVYLGSDGVVAAAEDDVAGTHAQGDALGGDVLGLDRKSVV